MQRNSNFLLAAGLVLCLAAPALAQPTPSDAANDFKATGHQLGQGHVVQGATDFGHGIKNGAIVSYHAVKGTVHTGADKVSNGTASN